MLSKFKCYTYTICPLKYTEAKYITNELYQEKTTLTEIQMNALGTSAGEDQVSPVSVTKPSSSKTHYFNFDILINYLQYFKYLICFKE